MTYGGIDTDKMQQVLNDLESIKTNMLNCIDRILDESLPKVENNYVGQAAETTKANLRTAREQANNAVTDIIKEIKDRINDQITANTKTDAELAG